MTKDADSPPPPWMNGDVIVACADLIDRCGATEFEIGFLHDDVPAAEAGWYAHAKFKGGRLTVEDHASPSAAALALGERLLAGGRCRCGQPVTLDEDRPGCRWRLMGKRWEPGCDAPSIDLPTETRGDLGAMHQAIGAQAPNRAARRAKKGRRG